MSHIHIIIAPLLFLYFILFSSPTPSPPSLPWQYLRDTLKPFICVVLECEEDCEVDPMKISAGASLPQNQVALTHLVQEAWMFICRSIPNFPRLVWVCAVLWVCAWH